MNVFSFGGGVQSVACLILSAQGKIDCDTFVFANVGDDSEHPATLDYFRNVAIPYARLRHIELLEVRRQKRDGSFPTIYQTMLSNQRAPIPVYLSNGAPAKRACTVDYKIRVIEKWCKRNGATKENPYNMLLGISFDEWKRMRTSQSLYMKNVYPLVAMRLSRTDCIDIIIGEGLSIPHKSACWFCPYHSSDAWLELRSEEPELFEKACQMEALKNKQLHALNKSSVWLTRKRIPLASAIEDVIPDEMCDGGYCGL